jgi:hypothetical protein
MVMRGFRSPHDVPVQAALTRGWWKTVAAWALACLLMLGMLLAFHAVMSGAVQQAASRQQTLAAHAEATWRCKTLRGLHASVTCLSQLNASAPAEVSVQVLSLGNGLPVE